MAISDIKGKKFNRLTAIERAPNRVNCKNTIWNFLCDCGSITIAFRSAVTSGKTKSCGCLKDEITADRFRKRATHGQSKTKLYRVWAGMKGRCKNSKNINYKIYGARGIKVCDRWLDFSLFFKDVGNEYKEGLELDRIDVNGNYEPLNVRWSTPSENQKNKRNKAILQSKYEGVYWQKRTKGWAARLYLGGKFATEEEAYSIYIKVQAYLKSIT